MGSKPFGISGSRAAAVLGISGYNTKFAVWQEIMEEQKPGWNAAHGFLLPERETTVAMRWGTAFEDTIATLTQKHFKKLVINREKLYSDTISTKIPITCHVDGIINGMLYEAKTTASITFNNLWTESSIPAYYYAQVQHNLYLTNLKKAVVVCLEFPKTPEQWERTGITIYYDDKKKAYVIRDTSGDSCSVDNWGIALYNMGYYHTYTVEADREKQEAMIQAYKEFYRSIKEENPPEPENYDDIKRLFPSPAGTLVLSDEMEAKLLEYRNITQSLSDTSPAGKRRDQLKIDILSWAQKHSTIDTETTERLIIKNKDGIKLGSFSKTKTGTLIFRT